MAASGITNVALDGNLAKRQVSIKLDIAKARIEFYKRNQVMPTTLYIGHEDFYNLCRECESWDLVPIDRYYTFMGMQVLRVDRDHHINVTSMVGATPCP